MAEKKPLISLVEDDVRLSKLISGYLENSGFRMAIANLEEDVVAQVEQMSPDLVILDLGLPREDGLTICKRLRAISDVPILILTARDNDIDHVLGLELGADDYVIKPIKPRVLQARISALLRRSHVLPDNGKVLRFGSLTIDATSRTVTLEGQEVALSSSEFDLLAHLAAHAGEVQSREAAFRAVLKRDYDGMDRVLDVRISHLRRKLGDNPEDPGRIKTIWGHGYLFVPTAW